VGESRTVEARDQTTQVSSQGGLELQTLYVWLEKGEVALGFPLLPLASGEAGRLGREL